MLSVILPVYNNAASLPELLEQLCLMREQCAQGMEAVFVVDGSPDDSHAWLREHLANQPFPSQLLDLSRNFGSFAAIRAGLAAARGKQFAVMAADLQDPPEAVLKLAEAVQSGEADIAFGVRASRADPWLSRLCSCLFWGAYRALVQKEMPRGGIDIFACTLAVRDRLMECGESNGMLVGLLLWIGFRRVTVPYSRLPRKHGKSAWHWRRKFRYMADSILAFSDLPIILLVVFGMLGTLVSLAMGLVVLAVQISGGIDVPGYAATVITILFFAGLNSLGMGIIGSYVWRTFENTKQRPPYLIARHTRFGRYEEGA